MAPCIPETNPLLKETLLLLLLYGLAAAATTAAVRWLRKPLPKRIGWAFFLLPLLFFLPTFSSGRTPLPVDHSLNLPPWSDAYVAPKLFNPHLNDLVMHFAPWTRAVHTAWKEGALPLRNRWNGAGQPLAANGQSAAFSPLTVLMYPLPLAHGYTLAGAVKLFLCLAGMWLWLRELGVSPPAALFGAVAFSFSLTMTAWILFPLTGVNALWPWALFGIELLRSREPGMASRATRALVVIFALLFLNGHPESAATGAAFVILWLFARLAFRDLPDAARVFPRAALASLVATGLCAFLLLPQIFSILASNRAAFWKGLWTPILSWAPRAPGWPGALLPLFFPRTFGDRVGSPPIPGAGGAYPEMALGYIGIVGCAVALLILRPGSPRSRSEKALLVPLVFGFGIAAGIWPFPEILSLIPGLPLVLPLRFLSWVALAGAAIAAFELDRLIRDMPGRPRGAVLFPLALSGVLTLAAIAAHRHFRELHRAAGGLASQKEALAMALVGLALFSIAILFARGRAAFPLASVLTLLCGAELFQQGARLHSWGNPSDLYPPVPALEFLRSRAGTFRVLGEGAELYPNSNVFAELEEVRVYDPVERRDYVEFLDLTAGYPPDELFKNLRDLNAPVLDFLNVRYLISYSGRTPPAQKWRQVYAGGDASVFENSRVLERVFVPGSTRRIAADSPGFLPAANGMRAFREVWPELARRRDWAGPANIAVSPAELALWPEGPQPGQVTISGYREELNSASFRARNPTQAPVVLVASLVQDGGWSARDERGQPLPMTRANGPFLALSLPPGEHRVALSYTPPGMRVGGMVTLVVVIVVFLAALLRRLRPKGDLPPRAHRSRTAHVRAGSAASYEHPAGCSSSTQHCSDPLDLAQRGEGRRSRHQP